MIGTTLTVIGMLMVLQPFMVKRVHHVLELAMIGAALRTAYVAEPEVPQAFERMIAELTHTV